MSESVADPVYMRVVLLISPRGAVAVVTIGETQATEEDPEQASVPGIGATQDTDDVPPADSSEAATHEAVNEAAACPPDDRADEAPPAPTNDAALVAEEENDVDP